MPNRDSDSERDGSRSGGDRSVDGGRRRETVNCGTLVHTERNLKESLTLAYRIRVELATFEADVAATLEEVRVRYATLRTVPSTEDHLAEAVYCYRPDLVATATQARSLLPASVVRRFDRVVQRPRRLDDRLPNSARDVEYGGRRVDDWVAELLALAEAVEERRDACLESVTQLEDVADDPAPYLVGERDLRPVTRGSLES